jgi:hypothetical protein
LGATVEVSRELTVPVWQGFEVELIGQEQVKVRLV